MRNITFIYLLCAGMAHGAVALPASAVPATISVPSGTVNGQSFHVQARAHGTTIQGQLFDVGGYSASINSSGLMFFTLPDTAYPSAGNCDVTVTGLTDITVDITRDLTTSTLYPLGFVRGSVFNTLTGSFIHSCIFTITTVASGSAIAAGGISIGGNYDGGHSGTLDFVRWFTGASVNQAPVAPFVASPAPWLDYEFGTGSAVNNDTSSGGYAQNFSVIAGLTNVGYPTGLSPVCSAGTPQTVSSGTAMSLSAAYSYSLNGSAPLTYSWSTSAGADGVSQTWAGSTSQSPTVAGAGLITFGSFNGNLTVTDTSSNSTSCTVHNGVVKTTNAAGAINEAAEGMTAFQQFVVGPLVQFGKNPWPWADTAIEYQRQLQTAYLTGGYAPYWRTTVAGETITLTAGNSAAVGSGTTFTSQFCGGSGGGTSWDGVHIFTFPYTGLDGRQHYGEFYPKSCADDTHLTLAFNGSTYSYPVSPQYPWPSCPGPTGCTYSFTIVDTTTAPFITWQSSPPFGAPAQYYDNTESALTNYWRSGRDDFYSLASSLATYWEEWPTLDYYYNCYLFNNYSFGGEGYCPADKGRVLAVTGQLLWADMIGNPSWLLNSSTNYGSGPTSALRNVGDDYKLSLDSLQTNMTNRPLCLDDMRSDAYRISAISLISMKVSGQPNTDYLSTLNTGMTGGGFWPSCERTAPFRGFNVLLGSTNNTTGTSITLGGGTGSVDITDTTHITGTGTSFNSGMIGLPIWTYWESAGPGTVPAYCGTCSANGSNANGDAQSYIITGVSGQVLTISPPYTGSTHLTGRGYILGANGIPGYDVQPFMAGLLGEAFYHCAGATTGATKTACLGFAHDEANFVASYGLSPPITSNPATSGSGGLYNGAFGPGCVPPMFLNSTGAQQNCFGSSGNNDGLPVTPSQGRVIGLETMRLFSYDYSTYGTNASAANLLMNQAFSRPGVQDSLTDGYYLSDFDISPLCFGPSYPLAGNSVFPLPSSCNGTGFYVGALVPGAVSFYPYPAKWAGELGGFTGGATSWSGMIVQSPRGQSAIGGRSVFGGSTKH